MERLLPRTSPRPAGPFPRLLTGCEPTEDKMRVELQPTGPCGTISSSQRGNAGAKGQGACHSRTRGRTRIKPKGPGCSAMPPAAALNWLTASPHLTSAKSFAAVIRVHAPGSPVTWASKTVPAFCAESLKPGGPYETGTTLGTPAPTGCSLLWSLGSRGPHQIEWISFLLSTSKQIEMFRSSLKVTLGLILSLYQDLGFFFY